MESRRSYRGLGRILLGLLVLAMSSSVLYGSEPDPLRFQDEIQKDIQSWGDNLKEPITTLFWLLVTLDFSWTCIQLALKAGGLEDFVGTFIKKLFFYGIGVFLLLNGTDYAFAIVDSFIRLAGIAAGVSTENPVAGIWDYTFQAIDDMYRDVSVWSNPVRTFVNGLAILGMGVLGAYISVVLILAYCEGYIVISLAFVFLAFGGSGFIQDPVTPVFNAPVLPDQLPEQLRIGLVAGDVVTLLHAGFPGGQFLPVSLHADDAPQPGPVPAFEFVNPLKCVGGHDNTPLMTPVSFVFTIAHRDGFAPLFGIPDLPGATEKLFHAFVQRALVPF